MPNGFLLSLLLDTQQGTVTELTEEQVQQWQPGQGILWLHMNYQNPIARQWVNNADLPQLDVQALLTPTPRPRVDISPERLMMTLSSINLEQESPAQDMIALRIYADNHRIITTSDRQLNAIGDMANLLIKGQGPTKPGSFVLELCRRLTLNKLELIDALEDQLADLEDMVLQHDTPSQARSGLAELRRRAIALRRHLLPQKEAFMKVVDTPCLMSAEEKIHMHEIYSTLQRVIEDLDAIRDRAIVTHEELASRQTEQLNQRLYLLSLITSIFLPLGFLTGLLGVNIGGIPGVNDPKAFAYFCLGLGGLLLIQILLLYRFRWLRR
ncbi:CorA family divalent cation transporter [Shewanella sp. NFH-SH190041]|uniref:CorA family divalent cation transporter n=1 Tax=Shewanella sp. NFH-SH190041 TaxID=2950245 RepID=UPI0021C3CFCF|nr:CorA family divalent cation transporter [Shewanella sp. NFH-SH190041]